MKKNNNYERWFGQKKNLKPPLFIEWKGELTFLDSGEDYIIG